MWFINIMDNRSLEARVEARISSAKQDASRLAWRRATQEQIKQDVAEQTKNLAQNARGEARRAAALLASRGLEPDTKVLVRSTPITIQQEVGRTILGRKRYHYSKDREREYEKMLVVPIGSTSRTEFIELHGESDRLVTYYRPIGVAMDKGGELFKVVGHETTQGPKVTETPSTIVGRARDEDIVSLIGVMPGDNIVMPAVTIHPFIEGLEAAVASLIINSQNT